MKTDDGTNKQRTPPNSTGTSLSPLSTSYLSRLSSSNDNSPIRTTNTIRMTSPSNNNNNNGLTTSTKQVDAVTLLLTQSIAPAQLIQVRKKNKNDDIAKKRGGKKRNETRLLYIFIFMRLHNVDLNQKNKVCS